MASAILKRLKFDNATIREVTTYILYHDTDIQPTETAVRRAINQIGSDYFAGVLALKEADALAQSDYKREEKLTHLETLGHLYQKIIAEHQPTSLKDLKITGHDLIKLGCPQGKYIGNILTALLDDVIDNPDHNTADYLEEKASELIKSI
jgi:tRNA nucleotidyltransferase (CCA-adding enzyme)